MNNITIELGDKFIYCSKYGGVVKGDIGGFHCINSYDANLGAVILKYKIRSTKGIFYDLDEVQLVRNWLTDRQCESLKSSMEILMRAKERSRNKIMNRIKNHNDSTQLDSTGK